MKPGWQLPVLLVAVVASGLAGVGAELWLRASGAVDRSRTPPQDVIFITIDTLRADHLQAYGHEGVTTPHIDSLIRRGTKFTEATVPFPRTSPALASMVTGLWPHHHGSREVGEALKQGTTLAEILKDHGYQTYAVSANPKASPSQNLDRGFDDFVARRHFSARSIAERVNPHAFELIDKADPDRPMFLWVHYADPHWPYLPPKHYEAQPDAPKCHELRRRAGGGALTKGDLVANVGGVVDEALAQCKALYQAEVSYTDRYVGRLIDKLREAGRFDDALVVFTADHGENLGEQGVHFEHGPSLHDASMRVPLSIAGPKLYSGEVDDGVARIEDLMPTVLELLDIDRRTWPSMDGVSLAWRLSERYERPPEGEFPVAVAESGSALQTRLYDRLVSGRSGGWHCINDARFSLCRRGDGEPRLYDHEDDPGLKNPVGEQHPDVKRRLVEAAQRWKPEEARERAVRTARFKRVAYPQLDGSYERALYDLRSVPAEQKDVTGAHPEIAERLDRHLDRWASQLPDFEAPERSAEQLEQLRALGYVE